jgi:hypothetical protein
VNINAAYVQYATGDLSLKVYEDRREALYAQRDAKILEIDRAAEALRQQQTAADLARSQKEIADTRLAAAQTTWQAYQAQYAEANRGAQVPKNDAQRAAFTAAEREVTTATTAVTRTRNDVDQARALERVGTTERDSILNLIRQNETARADRAIDLHMQMLGSANPSNAGTRAALRAFRDEATREGGFLWMQGQPDRRAPSGDLNRMTYLTQARRLAGTPGAYDSSTGTYTTPAQVTGAFAAARAADPTAVVPNAPGASNPAAVTDPANPNVPDVNPAAPSAGSGR